MDIPPGLVVSSSTQCLSGLLCLRKNDFPAYCLIATPTAPLDGSRRREFFFCLRLREGLVFLRHQSEPSTLQN